MDQLNSDGGSISTMSMIPSGVAGVSATLKVMSALAFQGKINPTVRDRAMAVTIGLTSKDWVQQAQCIHSWVRANVRYIMDVEGVETLQTAETTLRVQGGDCDDSSVLIASMLGALGHPTRFFAMGFAPNDFEHVVCETKIGNRWFACDATENVPFGWLPDGIVARLWRYNK